MYVKLKLNTQTHISLKACKFVSNWELYTQHTPLGSHLHHDRSFLLVSMPSTNDRCTAPCRHQSALFQRYKQPSSRGPMHSVLNNYSGWAHLTLFQCTLHHNMPYLIILRMRSPCTPRIYLKVVCVQTREQVIKSSKDRVWQEASPWTVTSSIQQY